MFYVFLSYHGYVCVDYYLLISKNIICHKIYMSDTNISTLKNQTLKVLKVINVNDTLYFEHSFLATNSISI